MKCHSFCRVLVKRITKKYYDNYEFVNHIHDNKINFRVIKRLLNTSEKNNNDVTNTAKKMDSNVNGDDGQPNINTNSSEKKVLVRDDSHKNEQHKNDEHQTTHLSDRFRIQVLNEHLNQARTRIQELNVAYQDIENTLMERIHESNRSRFRVILTASVVGIVLILSLFGDQLRYYLTRETASLAKETLENESLKIQTQELAMAVVQTILNDKDITAHAATFLKEASTAPETQEALLKLLLHVLQHEDSLAQVQKLVKQLLDNLIKDQATVDQLGNLLGLAIQTQSCQKALYKVLFDLCQDPEVVEMFAKLITILSNHPEVSQELQKLLTNSTNALLKDEKVIEESKIFVADVVNDAALQKEGGNALWKSITHALQPTVIRLSLLS